MANFLSGEDMKADLNGVPYHIRKFGLKFKRPGLDVTNSEGETGNPVPPEGADTEASGWQAMLHGNRAVELTIEEATMDLDASLFDGPVLLAQDAYCVWKIYPEGRTGDYHYLPMMCTEIDHSGDVKDLQPITGTFASDGRCYLYGEEKPAGA